MIGKYVWLTKKEKEWVWKKEGNEEGIIVIREEDTGIWLISWIDEEIPLLFFGN